MNTVAREVLIVCLRDVELPRRVASNAFTVQAVPLDAAAASGTTKDSAASSDACRRGCIPAGSRTAPACVGGLRAHPASNRNTDNTKDLKKTVLFSIGMGLHQ